MRKGLDSYTAQLNLSRMSLKAPNTRNVSNQKCLR